MLVAASPDGTYILRVGAKGFDIHGLNLIVMGPDDFATAVH